MFITRVDIKNFRNIDQLSIEFKNGFNLIKGADGKGKTSILEAIAVGLGGFTAGFHDVTTIHFSKDEIRRVSTLSGGGDDDETYKVPIEVTLKAVLDGEEYEWSRRKTSIKASRSTIQPRNICKAAEKISSDVDAEYPVLIYQGAKRIWSQEIGKEENIRKNKYFRSAGYEDALSEILNIKQLLNWCIKMEQVSWQKGKKIAEYEAVKRAVSDFMTYMNEEGIHQVFYDKQLEELMYCSNEVLFPISNLSAGYQSLIWMVFDIAYRMAVLNPDKMENVCLTKGIVLIDEIDIHLNLKWQRNIIDALRKTFPNVQFIATAQETILLGSAKDVWIVDTD